MGIDWSGLWAVFSGIITIYVLSKMLFIGLMNCWERRAWKRYMKGGVMVLALFVYGCAGMMSYVPIVRVPDHSGVYAITTCDLREDKPVIVVYANTPKEAEYYILVHEMEHIAQIEREGSCKAFMRRYAASDEFKLETEGGAECAMFNAYHEDGHNPSERSLVDHMRSRFPDFTEADIVEALPCVPYSPTGSSDG